VDTLARYGHAIDYGLEAVWLDCFTDDGAFDVRARNSAEMTRRFEGRSQLAGFVAQHTRAPDAYHKHLMVEPRVTVDGDEATAESYFVRVDADMAASGAPGATRIVAIGRYRDRLTRGPDGRWRFRERIAEVEDR
jgi:alpha-D-ribose 1-methylphosphonate 5-triphosphate diphosphatase PhnM